MKSVKRAAHGEKLSNSVEFLGKMGDSRCSIGLYNGQSDKENQVGLSYRGEQVDTRMNFV